jgi:hypothetical protein
MYLNAPSLAKSFYSMVHEKSQSSIEHGKGMAKRGSPAKHNIGKAAKKPAGSRSVKP